MKADEQVAERLLVILDQAVREAGRLESTLERETAALSALDAELLNSVVASKHAFARALETLTQQHGALLESAGYGTALSGMERFLRENDGEGLLRRRWDQLLAIMEQCRRLNQINGGVVRTQQMQVQQSLQRLGRENGTPDLYGPGGRRVSSAMSRPLVQA
jgi:flagella synthesis protein FlgN